MELLLIPTAMTTMMIPVTTSVKTITTTAIRHPNTDA